jgi:lipid II:glycine glycyltransferase (peptidoglycan interpeptide bridge formation enzyme)
VALPFSDHCEPLVDGDEDAIELLSHACQDAAKSRYRFVEIRPLGFDRQELHSGTGFELSKSYSSHRIDLRPALQELFASFHKDCIQRKIRRAEKEHLEYREGRSEELLRMFFTLLVTTRRKHRLPPQPIHWFRNLLNCMRDDLQIRLALKGGRPVAAIMTMTWRDTLVYKYGCSDAQFNNLGGTPLLFWKAIQAAKARDLKWFDLGRSDTDNTGLITFKEHWGAIRSPLCYWRWPAPGPRKHVDWSAALAGQVFRRMPDSVLAMTGRLLYKHIG